MTMDATLDCWQVIAVQVLGLDPTETRNAEFLRSATATSTVGTEAYGQFWLQTGGKIYHQLVKYFDPKNLTYLIVWALGDRR